MTFLENKLQNIYNKLSLLLSQFTAIHIQKISLIPVLINEIIVGIDKLKLYINDSVEYNLNEYDLKYVTAIGNYAFSNCTSLTSITIPDGVTNIGNYAFSNCTSLTDVHIGNGIVIINRQTFQGCINLTDITIPNGVKTIGMMAFQGCTNLVDVDIPSSVDVIDNLVFTGCTNLTDIYLYPTTPPSLGNTTAIPNTTTIHVPIGSGDAYKAATNWSYHSSRIVEDIEI